MKTLKFDAYLVPLIQSGEKTTTWRLFDDKNLTKGDNLSFLNFDTKEEFAKAKIENVDSKKFSELTEKDWEGHEKFSNDEEMYKTYTSYYKKEVNKDTEVKIIRFSLL